MAWREFAMVPSLLRSHQNKVAQEAASAWKKPHESFGYRRCLSLFALPAIFITRCAHTHHSRSQVASRHNELRLYVNFCGGPPSAFLPWLQNAPPRVIVPSLHLLGETDELFSTEELHELHELCLDRTVLTHLRGHVVPILNVAMAQRICAFIAGVLPIEGDLDARVPPLTFASSKQAQYMSAGVDAGASNAVPQAEASYDSSSLFTRIIPHNDDGLVGHVNFLLVFGVTYWHAVGPTISRKGATLDGRLFDLTVPHNAGLWTLGSSSHLLLSNLGISLNVAFLMVGATDCLEPADLGFIRRKILPLVLIVLIVHAVGTALSPRGPLGSLCGPRCKACVHGLTIESWFLNELILLRMLRVCASMLHASPRTLPSLLFCSSCSTRRASCFLSSTSTWACLWLSEAVPFVLRPRLALPFMIPMWACSSTLALLSLCARVLPSARGHRCVWNKRPAPNTQLISAFICACTCSAPRQANGYAARLALWVLLPAWAVGSVARFAYMSRRFDGWGQCAREKGRLPVGGLGSAGTAAQGCCKAFAHDLLRSSPVGGNGARLLAHYFHDEAFALFVLLVLLVTLLATRHSTRSRRVAIVIGVLIVSTRFFVDRSLALCFRITPGRMAGRVSIRPATPSCLRPLCGAVSPTWPVSRGF